VIPPSGISPGLPSQPIYIPPAPDQGLPGQPPRPDQGLPPFPGRPDQGLPGQPPYPSTGPGFPTHPIVLPPIPPVLPEDKALVFVKTSGVEGVWFILDKDENLKPPTHPQPKPSK